MGGATSLCVASESKGLGERAARSRMSREVHVRSLWGTGGEIPPVYPARLRCKRKSHKWAEPARAKVRMRSSGADCPVVVMKRSNVRGAKGAGHSRPDHVGQLATGGTD